MHMVISTEFSSYYHKWLYSLSKELVKINSVIIYNCISSNALKILSDKDKFEVIFA